MINRIEKILKENKEVSAYLIEEKKTESIELFYVLKNLEMNRATDYNEYAVTCYKDFSNFRGSASFNLNKSVSDDEIKQKVNEALFSASFVQNLFYELPKKEDVSYKNNSNFKEKPLMAYCKPIVNAIFSCDCYQNGWINSTEIFLKHTKTQLVNSNGVDYTYDYYSLMVEVIPTWENNKIEVELYKSFEMPNFDLEKIKNEVNDILILSKDRSEAVSIPKDLKCKVLIQDSEVLQLFRSFSNDLNYSNIYRNISLSTIGKSVQGDSVVGDKIDITLKAQLENSIYNAPIDESGVVLKDINIIENGIAKNSHGSYRFGYYLNIENPSGNIRNLECKCGSKSIDEMKKEPYLLCVSFSGLQINLYDNFIGGEVRLGYYFDGQSVTPVTGFSISGNLNEIKKNLVFSKEEVLLNGYKGPKYLEIKNIAIL